MKWIEFLENKANVIADSIAVVDQRSGRDISYARLNQMANNWAQFFCDHNVQKGDRVAILACNRLEHLSLLFAASKVGAILVPMNFRLAKEENNTILKRMEPKILFGTEELFLDFEGPFYNLETMNLDFLNSEENHNEKFYEINASLEDDILMLFTSGTTGEPKGVLMHGKMLWTNQLNTCEQWELYSTDTTLVETPFFHTGGYNVLCLPLLALGGKVILAEKFDIDNVYTTLVKEEVSVYFGVPTMFQLIQENNKFYDADFSSIRFFISGGAACPIEMITAYQKKGLLFKQGFGLTEIGPNCFLLQSEDAIRKLGAIGKPMPHSIVKVINDDGEEVDCGEVGQLLLKGDHLCRSYFNDEAKFESCKTDGYLRTGDLVKCDEEGFFFVVGRKKDMYITGGENVFPGEVEKQLLEHNKISDAVVVSVPCDKWGEVGHAFLRTDEKCFMLSDVREFLADKLSRYKHPQSIHCLLKFPLLANGKVDRVSLKNIALEQTIN
jgi:fatty-acyl-CoA synthase